IAPLSIGLPGRCLPSCVVHDFVVCPARRSSCASLVTEPTRRKRLKISRSSSASPSCTTSLRSMTFSIDGPDLTECVHPEALRRYEIDVLVLCKALRHASALNGAPVERVSHRLFYLGDHSAGERRRPVYLARLLRAENALDTAFAVRGRSGPGEIVMLTPTVRPIGSELMRQLAQAGVAMLAISEILSAGANDLFVLSIPISRLCAATDPSAA